MFSASGGSGGGTGMESTLHLLVWNEDSDSKRLDNDVKDKE